MNDETTGKEVVSTDAALEFLESADADLLRIAVVVAALEIASLRNRIHQLELGNALSRFKRPVGRPRQHKPKKQTRRGRMPWLELADKQREVLEELGQSYSDIAAAHRIMESLVNREDWPEHEWQAEATRIRNSMLICTES